jgi:hypothetical protein
MKVYDGLTDYVASAEEAERVRRTLYRTDLAARATVLPAYRERLEPSDLGRFHDEGYLAMEGLLTSDEVAACAAALDDLARRRPDGVGLQDEPYYQQGGEEPAASAPELRVRKLWRFAGVDPILGAAVTAPRITAILDELIGPGARLIQDMALMKPPHRGAEKPWHQDNAYFDCTPLDGILGVWIALDPATVENGCMQIVPGSHRAGPGRSLSRARLPAGRRGVARGPGRGGPARAWRCPVLLGAAPPRDPAEPEPGPPACPSVSLRGGAMPAHDVPRAHDTLRPRRRLRRLPRLGHGRRRVAGATVAVRTPMEATR